MADTGPLPPTPTSFLPPCMAVCDRLGPQTRAVRVGGHTFRTWLQEITERGEGVGEGGEVKRLFNQPGLKRKRTQKRYLTSAALSSPGSTSGGGRTVGGGEEI